jgi:death-on-curing protein
LPVNGCTRTITKWLLPTAIIFVKDHPFIDGNKRTALAAALVFLELNGISVLDPRGRLKTAMFQLASGKMSKADFAKLLRKLPRSKP